MLSWFMSNIGTIIVALIVAAVVAVVVIQMIRDKRKGKSSCGAGCAHCAAAGKCPHHNSQK